ncbi:MAG: RidA family protein [Defluviitaleaceae bacterium]|nr:RidA family protein [Defluviitaleaceae bacterium]
MKTIISTPNAPAAIGPYSQATAHSGIIYVSGQLPIDPTTGELSGETISDQTTLALKNIAAIVEAAGSNMQNILKTTILLTDLSNFAAVNEAYAKFFPTAPPARACYQVCALPKNANIEIEAICAL